MIRFDLLVKKLSKCLIFVAVCSALCVGAEILEKQTAPTTAYFKCDKENVPYVKINFTADMSLDDLRETLDKVMADKGIFVAVVHEDDKGVELLKHHSPYAASSWAL